MNAQRTSFCPCVIDRSGQVLFDFILDTDACSTYFEDRVPRIFAEDSQPSARLSIWLKDLVSVSSRKTRVVACRADITKSLAFAELGVKQYFSPLQAHVLETYKAAATLLGDDAGDHQIYRLW
jgi:hypothetical protein